MTSDATTVSHEVDKTRPVLLVHGFATSARRTWREPGWIDLLTDAGRTVIAPDLLGHGEADKPHDVAAYTQVEDLVRDAMPADGQVDAVGYSAGARILLALASREPDRFGRLVIGGMGERLFQHREGPSPIVAALEGTGDPDDRVGAHFRDLASTDGNDPEALLAFMKREQWRVDREHVEAITVPTMVIIGDKDFAGPGDGLAEALPMGELVTLRGVDHFGLPKAFDFVEKGLDFLGAAPF
ncbi:MAG: alpha/beta fold hydrolase [Acidimicrobiales bacterium]